MRVMACVLACLALAGGVAAGGAAAPQDANVVLILEGALSQGGEQRADLELEFPVRGGKWPDSCWGYATWYSRGHHEGVVTRHEAAGDGRRLTVDLRVGGDPWTRGGKAAYQVDLKVEPGGGLAGTYTGTFAPEAAKAGPVVRSDAPEPAADGEGMPAELRRAVENRRAPAPAAPAEGSPGGPGAAEAPAAGPVPAEAPPFGTTGPDAAGGVIRVSGTVRGRLDPPWPGVVAGHVPLEPGEHPRLALRKAQVPLLRKRAAETPEGKAMLARALAVMERAPSENDKFTTWPAVGCGFAWQMTGEKKYADRAREIVLKTLLENPAGRRGSGISQDIHHGPRLLGLALAYDLACDAWDDAFRGRCVDEIQQRTRELATGQFEGRNMGGLNMNVWSNHNGIRAGCWGTGALAVLGEKNSRGEVLADAEYLAETAAREVRGYLLMGLGGSGWGMEGAFYKVMTIERGLAHFLHAYENVLGRQADPGAIGDFTLAGYFMEAPPGDLLPRLDDAVWSVALITVPPDLVPGVKWLHARSVGLEGDKTFGIGYGLQAPFAMARYPYDAAARPPVECFPWVAPDPRKGHYVFRPTYRDKDDVLLVLNLKSEVLRACHYERAGDVSEMHLWGLGTKWLGGQYLVKVRDRMAVNIHHGPRVLASRETPDRTCAMTMDLDRCYLQELEAKKGGAPPRTEAGGGLVRFPYWGNPFVDFGIRGRRAMAVDASGRSGTPLVVALVDRLWSVGKGEGGAGAAAGGGAVATAAAAGAAAPGASAPQGAAVPSAWSLPLAGKAGRLTVDGNRFTVTAADGAMLTGVLVTPGRMDARSVSAEGDGTYFVVFALQKAGAPAPEFQVEGQGLAARVTVGGRTVRFADGAIVLE